MATAAPISAREIRRPASTASCSRSGVAGWVGGAGRVSASTASATAPRAAMAAKAACQPPRAASQVPQGTPTAMDTVAAVDSTARLRPRRCSGERSATAAKMAGTAAAAAAAEATRSSTAAA